MFHFKSHFDYPAGKPILPRLLRCQWFRVGDYTFAIGRLEAGATSTFAQLGFKNVSYKQKVISYLLLAIRNQLRPRGCPLQITNNL
jgi:hypothetical protein